MNRIRPEKYEPVEKVQIINDKTLLKKTELNMISSHEKIITRAEKPLALLLLIMLYNSFGKMSMLFMCSITKSEL